MSNTISASSIGDLHRPRSSFSSLSLNSWPVPPLQQRASPVSGLPLDIDTMPFSEFFAGDLLDSSAINAIPERILSPKKSDISIKTYVLEDSVVSQIVGSVGQYEDPWLSRRKSILPTIAEQDDQLEKCSVETHSIQASEQPFEVDLDNCLLTTIIQGGTPIPETTLLYAAQLVASISSLHSAGVVHGLISPETVAIRNQKYLVLCDCERRTQTATPSLRHSAPVRDHEHQRMYLYNAPEIVLGWTQGSAVDSWGFGIVLYHMLIGFHPFGDRDGQEDRIVNAKSHTLRYLDLVDRDARDLVSKCLERNPALRPSIPEIKAHPYFSAIDWSKMITRYVRVPLNDEPLADSPALARPRSMLLTPVEKPANSLTKAELGVSDLGFTFEGAKSCSEASHQTIAEFIPSIPASAAKSEWFLSTTDVLATAADPMAKRSEEVYVETTGEEHSSPQNEIVQQEVVHSGNDNSNDRDPRMKLFWDMLDSGPDAQDSSVPADELSSTLSYFTSRPRRPRSRQPSGLSFGAQLSLWRSSIEASSSRFHDRSKLEDKNKCIIKPATQITEPTKPLLDFPPGIERIGNGIGYTYAMPAASRSKVSVCSTVPRSCHGMFSYSPKFTLGLGLGIGSNKAKPKSLGNMNNALKNSFGTSRNETSPESSPEWNMSPFCGNDVTTVIYASSRPTLTNAVPTSWLESPQQDSEGEESDEAGPLTPDTVALENRQDKDKLFGEQDVYEEITETPTLRLVSQKE